MEFLRTDPRRLWIRYVVAILLIVILISSEHFFAVSATEGSPGITSAVNESGRQRMLSQRILYFSSEVRQDPSNADTKAMLMDTVTLFESAHIKLSRETEEAFGFGLPDGLRTLYFERGTEGGPSLDSLMTDFVSDAMSVIEGNPGLADPAWERMRTLGPTMLLQQLDQAVKQFEAESRVATEKSLRIQNISYILALSVLLLEVLFIFWPAHRSILRSFKELEESHAETQALLVETEAARDEAAVASQAKSEFLATISHEVRTPINGVLGIANVMLTEQLSTRHREQIRLIQESGDHLMELLNSVLDISRIDAGKFEIQEDSFSLKRALEFACAIWESRYQAAGLTFTMVEELDDVDMILTDKTRMRQILFNLMNNAGKFTETGGISLHAVIDTSGTTDMLRFEITDTGIGISPEEVERLFKPFEQADSSNARKYGGTGLGLAICKKLVDLMGGKIGASSKLGEGSTFWFTIPLKRSDEEVESLIDLESTAPAVLVMKDGSPINVLAAEDNQINQVVLQSLLSPLGCNVEIVQNGEQAVDAALRGAYDLILMDVQMPVMDGIEATVAIRSAAGTLAETPIVALTANAMQGDRDRYLTAGMDDYITKPIDPRDLYATITRTLGDKLARADTLEHHEDDEGPWASADEAPSDIQNLLKSLDGLK